MDHTFLARTGPAPGSDPTQPPWRVLIADEDNTIHQTVRTALANFQVDRRGVECLVAHTVEQAKAIGLAVPDLAVLLIDVAVEGRDSGFRVIEFLRRRYGSNLRVILWAGQPDVMAERSAVERYGVDSYLRKADLTADRLCVAVLRSLRIHTELSSRESSRRAMSRVMVATSGLFDTRSSADFYYNLLAQMNGLVDIAPHSLLCVRNEDIPADGVIRVRAGTGRFVAMRDIEMDRIGEPAVQAVIAQSFENGDTVQTDRYLALSLRAHSDAMAVALIEGSRPLTSVEWQMMEIFRNKASVAFNNLLLVNELNAAQKATVLALAQVAEYKDNVASGHLQRIERLTVETTRELYRRGPYPDEITQFLIDRIGMASILHDVGMICVPDKVMFSTEQLLADDYKLIRHHPRVGWEILRSAAAPLRGPSVLSIAAEIARSHHEKFGGGGYPANTSGQDIPIVGRIVAVVDVFDALITDRRHRQAWTVEHARAWITGQAGTHFDPVVVDAFQCVIERLLKNEPEWLPGTAAADRTLMATVGDRLRGWANKLLPL